METTYHHKNKVSLGWRLALSTSLIVAIVMGSISAFQMAQNIEEERRSHEALLKHSLTPLVMQLSNIKKPHEVLSAIETFHIAYVSSGHSHHHMIVEDENRNSIFSTMHESKSMDNNVFHVSVPFSSPSLSGSIGYITVYEDASIFQSQVSRRWLGWLQHMVVTLGAIVIFLLIAIRIQVTKPLELLRNDIRKMQMGYWDDIVIPDGAWEIQWLAIRFRAMTSELKKTLKHLLEAERYSQNVLKIAEKTCQSTFKTQKMKAIDLNNIDHDWRTKHVSSELNKMCVQLEQMVPEDPGSEETIKKILEVYTALREQPISYNLKIRIENEILRISEPVIYRDLNIKVKAFNKEMSHWAEQVKVRLHDRIESAMVPCLDIQFRTKQIAAIWTKMKEKNLKFSQVYDLFAFRIIVPTEVDCYRVLGVIHDNFTPVVERFKDYIKSPKSNGYQSLHTSVRDTQGPVFEVQIRSLAMHRNAETGDAAHWIYKQVKNQINPSKQSRSFFSKFSFM